MKLRDVLKPEHIIVPLRAATVKEATERLAERLIAANAVADQSITVNTNATVVSGSVLARNGAVTLDSNTITKATCATPPGWNC